MTDEHIGVIRPDHGGLLAYQLEGDAAGPVLLLLGCRGNSHHWWDRQRPMFNKQFTTLTVDYRGTGGSVDPDAHYLTHMQWSSTLFARDVAAVIDLLGVGPVNVYGTSFGGMVAQMLAVERADLVHRMVLAAATAGGPQAPAPAASVRRLLARTHARDSAPPQAILELLYTPQWFDQDREPLVFSTADMSPEAVRAHHRAAMSHDALDLLGSVPVPTLVLHGSSDPVLPLDGAEQLVQAMPDASLVVCEGRHAFFDEFAQTVVPLVTQFLLAP